MILYDTTILNINMECLNKSIDSCGALSSVVTAQEIRAKLLETCAASFEGLISLLVYPILFILNL